MTTEQRCFWHPGVAATHIVNLSDMPGKDLGACQVCEDRIKQAETDGKTSGNRFRLIEEKSYVCDICGFSSPNEQTIIDHLDTEHGITDAGPVGQINQQDGNLTLIQGDGSVTEIDLDEWIRKQFGQ